MRPTGGGPRPTSTRSSAPNISNLARLGDQLDEGVERLRADLASGAWQRRHLALAGLDEIDLGYRIVRTA